MAGTASFKTSCAVFTPVSASYAAKNVGSYSPLSTLNTPMGTLSSGAPNPNILFVNSLAPNKACILRSLASFICAGCIVASALCCTCWRVVLLPLKDSAKVCLGARSPMTCCNVLSTLLAFISASIREPCCTPSYKVCKTFCTSSSAAFVCATSNSCLNCSLPVGVKA